MDYSKLADYITRNWNEIFSRIQLVTNTRTQVELAKILDIRQSSVSNAKKRLSIPAEWLLTLTVTKNVNPRWVLFGSGQIDIGNMIEIPGEASFKECSIEEMVKELVERISPPDPQFRRDIANQISFKYFTLRETDTFAEILTNLLPRPYAKRVTDYLFNEVSDLPAEAKNLFVGRSPNKFPPEAKKMRETTILPKRGSGRTHRIIWQKKMPQRGVRK